MNYRDKNIGVFYAKPGTVIVKTTGRSIETIFNKDSTKFESYTWCAADDRYIYLYYSCKPFEEDAPGSVKFIIEVADITLEVREGLPMANLVQTIGCNFKVLVPETLARIV